MYNRNFSALMKIYLVTKSFTNCIKGYFNILISVRVQYKDCRYLIDFYYVTMDLVTLKNTWVNSRYLYDQD